MNRVVKQIPNGLCWLRIACVFSLFLFEPFSFWFMFIYIAAGLTDLIDGFLARKLKVNSKFGARLDGIADLLFMAVGLFIVIPVIRFPFWVFPVLTFLLLIRVISLTVAVIKFKQLVIIHTIANKILAMIAWLTFIFYLFIDIEIMLVIVCSVAFYAFTEELIINCTNKEKPDLEQKTYFSKRRLLNDHSSKNERRI